MKNLNLLKTLVDVFFFIGVLTVVTMLIITPIYLINPENSIPIMVSGQELSGTDVATKVVVVFTGVSSLFFLYAIYRLKQVLGLFMKREIFTEKVVTHFKSIGKCIVASTLLTTIPLFLYNISIQQNIKYEFNFGGFDSFLMSISLGLLFIVIGEIFNIAKNIKEENELTV